MCTVNFYYFAHKFCIIVSVLLLKLSCLQQNRNYAGGTDVNLFRFHDFEPRTFHFHFSNGTFKPNVTFLKRKYDKVLDPENETRENYPNMNNYSADRGGRGFHFHSTDKDMTVEVEFTIPFMRIPIERGMQLTKSTARNILNLKSGSLLWAGTFIAVGALVAGAWNTIAALKPALFPDKRSVRSENDFDDYIGSTTDQGDDIGTVINEKLLEHNIDLPACIQKRICQYVQKAADDVRSGEASGTQKILDGLVNSHIWPQYFRGTAVHFAIEAGRNSNCHKWKERCKLLKF